MTSAAVGTAVMFTMAMLLVVMAASYVGIEFQRTIEQILDGFIGTARNRHRGQSKRPPEPAGLRHRCRRQ